MNNIPPRLQPLHAQFTGVAREVLAPRAAQVDQEAVWPEHSFRDEIPEMAATLAQVMRGLH